MNISDSVAHEIGSKRSREQELCDETESPDAHQRKKQKGSNDKNRSEETKKCAECGKFRKLNRFTTKRNTQICQTCKSRSSITRCVNQNIERNKILFKQADRTLIPKICKGTVHGCGELRYACFDLEFSDFAKEEQSSSGFRNICLICQKNLRDDVMENNHKKEPEIMMKICGGSKTSKRGCLKLKLAHPDNRLSDFFRDNSKLSQYRTYCKECDFTPVNDLSPEELQRKRRLARIASRKRYKTNKYYNFAERTRKRILDSFKRYSKARDLKKPKLQTFKWGKKSEELIGCPMKMFYEYFMHHPKYNPKTEQHHDHILPVMAFKNLLNTEIGQRMCFSWINVQPLQALGPDGNLAKGAKYKSSDFCSYVSKFGQIERYCKQMVREHGWQLEWMLQVRDKFGLNNK